MDYVKGESKVLILVLMEDALRVKNLLEITTMAIGLNPCSNGRCSASQSEQASKTGAELVLILVLMEDALRESLIY